MTQAVLPPDAAEASDAHDAAALRQYVTFAVGDEVFAVDMAPVQEIIRVPGVVRVPLAPPCLDGLANLRGRVLPVVSLRRIFGLPVLDHGEATRAVVVDLGTALGFLVDRVASVVSADASQLESVDDIRSTVNSDLLLGVLKNVGGFPMVMVLDFARLVEREFAAIAAIATGGLLRGRTEAATDAADEDSTDEIQLVSFGVAGQEYALDIDVVQEIVQLPPQIVRVPNTPAQVLGLMTLRERLLPLVSLRSLFALPDRELDDKSRVVVVALGGLTVGVVTDSVSEVLRVPRPLVDDIPPLLARDGGLAEITRICRLDQGRRLVSVLSAPSLFDHSAVQSALHAAAEQESTMNRDSDDEIRTDDEEQLVVFRLAGGEYGVPIDTVQEIVRIPEELTAVPKAPDFVEGVINLRGAVLPVIDQRRRLGLPALERNDRQRIMVYLLGGVRTGFIVDAVTEVLKVPRTAIEPAPLLSEDQARLLGRVANLPERKRIIQLIDPAFLLDREGSEALAELTT